MITIARATTSEFEAVKGDFGFIVAACLEPAFGKPVAEWNALPVAPYRKNYRAWSDEDVGESDEAMFFVAMDGSGTVGRVSVSRNWNGYGLVDNLAVDETRRGSGIGKLLMDACAQWARTEKLAGLMLETQNNNVAACLFYERYGFVLGGIDRFLYRGEDPRTHEIALFWYLLFDNGVLRSGDRRA